MSYRSLVRVTAPAGPPVTIADVRSRLRIDFTDDDLTIGDLIDEAVEVIDGPNGIGICMVSQQWKLTLDEFPRVIYLPLTPVISVDSITYVDVDGVTQTLASSVYRAITVGDRAEIEEAFGQTWPGTRDIRGAVNVTFTAGFATVPAPLKNAVMMMIANWFEHREGMVIPPGAHELLNLYRVGTIAA